MKTLTPDRFGALWRLVGPLSPNGGEPTLLDLKRIAYREGILVCPPPYGLPAGSLLIDDHPEEINTFADFLIGKLTKNTSQPMKTKPLKVVKKPVTSPAYAFYLYEDKKLLHSFLDSISNIVQIVRITVEFRSDGVRIDSLHLTYSSDQYSTKLCTSFTIRPGQFVVFGDGIEVLSLNDFDNQYQVV